MIEVIYRFDPEGPPPPAAPGDALQAREALEEGNRRFVRLLDPSSSGDRREVIPIDPEGLGLSGLKGTAPKQAPFAIVLGCADARVPVELVFRRAVNDLFVVRVAGNVLGNACLGSIEYAVAHLGESVKLAVVLGHTSCGAVTAAVDAFLKPGAYPYVASTQGLRAVLDRLFAAVLGAAHSLEAAWGQDVSSRPGYREALVETAVIENAAVTALTLQQELESDCEVVFGVYDLASKRVRVPGSGDDDHGLCSPPTDLAEFRDLCLRAAQSDFVRSRLEGA